MPIKVICIVGSPHSGVELIDQILSKNLGKLSLGRVEGTGCYAQNIIDRYMCACTKKLNDCGFWKKIEEEYKRRKMGPGLPVFQRLDLKNPVHNKAFIESIFESTRSRVMIESTNNPNRIAVLAQTENISLKVIYMVKDGRAVAHLQSLNNKGKGIKKEIARWSKCNAIISKTISHYMIPYIRTRHEDFVRNTERELRRICEFTSIKYVRNMSEQRGWVNHGILHNQMARHAREQRKINNNYLSEISSLEWFLLTRKASKQLRLHQYPSKKEFPELINCNLIWG